MCTIAKHYFNTLLFELFFVFLRSMAQPNQNFANGSDSDGTPTCLLLYFNVIEPRSHARKHTFMVQQSNNKQLNGHQLMVNRFKNTISNQSSNQINQVNIFDTFNGITLVIDILIRITIFSLFLMH